MAALATILMYHDIRAPAATAWPKRYGLRSFLRPEQLAGHLDRLVSTGRPVVTVGAIVAALTNGLPLPPKAVALTFDDGLADHHDVVLPLLAERGLVGSFYLPSAPIAEGRVIDSHKIQFVLAAADSEQDVVAAVFDLVAEYRRAGASLPANQTLWEEHSHSPHPTNWWSREMVFVTRLLRSGLPATVRSDIIDRLFRTFVTSDEAAFAGDFYLSPAQAAALVSAGMELGGHGRHSINLQGLPPTFQAEEIAASADFLMGLIGKTAKGRLLFSYPNGGWDEATLEVLPPLGFAAGLTTHKAVVTKSSDSFRLPRFDAAQDFERALAAK